MSRYIGSSLSEQSDGLEIEADFQSLGSSIDAPVLCHLTSIILYSLNPILTLSLNPNPKIAFFLMGTGKNNFPSLTIHVRTSDPHKDSKKKNTPSVPKVMFDLLSDRQLPIPPLVWLTVFLSLLSLPVLPQEAAGRSMDRAQGFTTACLHSTVHPLTPWVVWPSVQFSTRTSHLK